MHTRRVLVRVNLLVHNSIRYSSQQQNTDHSEKISQEINSMHSFKRKRDDELKNASTSADTHHPFSLHVISNGYLGSAKSCILASSEANYLINCGENACRQIFHEGHILKKTRNVFITQFNHANTSGLMSLSLEYGGYEWPVTVHTKVDLGLRNKAAAQQNFPKNRSLFDKSCKVTQHNYSLNEQVYSDKHLKVHPIETSALTYSYLFKINKPLPKLIMPALTELNILPGPWIRELINGNDYTTSSGSVIKASDVLDYSNVFDKHVLFLELENLSELEQLGHNELINQHEIHLIVHMSKSDLLNDAKYVAWCREFKDKNCIHLYMDESVVSWSIRKMYSAQAQLNMANPELFPLLYTQTDQFMQAYDDCCLKEKTLQQRAKIVFARPNLEFKIKPNLWLNLDNVKPIENNLYRKEILEKFEAKLESPHDDVDKESVDAFNYLKSNSLKSSHEQALNQTAYPKVLFLGTTSSVSTSTRNFAAILVNVNETASLLMDCGEGTTLQLARFFGEHQLDKELTKIKLVYVSHAHMDHHNGLYSLVMRRFDAFAKLNLPYEKLEFMFPRFYIEHLIGLNEYFNGDLFDKISLCPNEAFYNYYKLLEPIKRSKLIIEKTGQIHENLSPEERAQMIERIKRKLSLSAIQTISVKHIPYSSAIYLTIGREPGKKPFKIVYSGDCRPSETLPKLCKDVDLLIHECTMDDSRLEEAISINHSTISEALEVSRKMNAKFTALTHFSARYGSIIHVDDVNQKNVGIAYDFMYLHPENLDQLEDVKKYFKVLFWNRLEENIAQRNKFILSKKLS